VGTSVGTRQHEVISFAPAALAIAAAATARSFAQGARNADVVFIDGGNRFLAHPIRHAQCELVGRRVDGPTDFAERAQLLN
jgi:hypothetical protein